MNIRNFAIIAHVDHGKSTLADRLIEHTSTISLREMQHQILDSNPIERERGITIKLAPVRMNYVLNHESYILNLIDTPGHVDFSYEVSRSLAACEGAILLVDATQGIQAQTLSHYNQAKKLGLTIIPVINKIDINTANIDESLRQIQEVLGFAKEDVLLVSGKTGQGVDKLLETIIAKIPKPQHLADGPLRALVFNSNYDPHLGVVAWVRIVDGSLVVGDKLKLMGSKALAATSELGVFSPKRLPVAKLSAGEVGYIVSTLRDISKLTVGDTLTSQEHPAQDLLPGYKPVNPVVFVSFYPVDGNEINVLRDALSKLKLQDAAMTYAAEFSPALGNGFRIGCLGLLHADIIQERLEREYGLSLVACAPSVGYEIVQKNKTIVQISKASDLPDLSLVDEIREPMIALAIFVPETYVGAVMQLCQDHRSTLKDMVYVGKQVSLTYDMPFSELIRQFYDQLKSVSAGFATVDYDQAGFRKANLSKLDILVAGERIDAFSQIIPTDWAQKLGRDIVEKIKETITRQNFEITIQAAIGGRIVARAEIKPYRKDVIAKLSGGDQTRKDKLLNKQKKGKSRMKRVGKVDISQDAFLAVLKV